MILKTTIAMKYTVLSGEHKYIVGEDSMADLVKTEYTRFLLWTQLAFM